MKRKRKTLRERAGTYCDRLKFVNNGLFKLHRYYGFMDGYRAAQRDARKKGKVRR